jgi:hypothetical protein
MYTNRMARSHYILVILLILLVGLTVGFYVYAKKGASAPDAQKAQEVTDIIAAVGGLMVLPEGEEPTVATVSSLEQLKGQPFFANAKIGYKVLIYTQARKAILYDPVAHKIVEVTQLSIDGAAR